MKKHILTAIILFFSFLFTSCEKYPDSLCPCGKVEISKKEYIAMCILPDIVSENSVNKLRIENHTKKDVTYGAHFYMEYFFEDKWSPIAWDFYFTDIGYILYSYKSIEWEMNLYSLAEKYNDTKKGKYRIIKNVGKCNLVAEFELK